MDRTDQSQVAYKIVLVIVFSRGSSPSFVTSCVLQNSVSTQDFSELSVKLGRENQISSVGEARWGEPQENVGGHRPTIAFVMTVVCVRERDNQVASGRVRILSCERSAEDLTSVHVVYQARCRPASLVRMYGRMLHMRRIDYVHRGKLSDCSERWKCLENGFQIFVLQTVGRTLVRANGVNLGDDMWSVRSYRSLKCDQRDIKCTPNLYMHSRTRYSRYSRNGCGVPTLGNMEKPAGPRL